MDKLIALGIAYFVGAMFVGYFLWKAWVRQTEKEYGDGWELPPSADLLVFGILTFIVAVVMVAVLGLVNWLGFYLSIRLDPLLLLGFIGGGVYAYMSWKTKCFESGWIELLVFVGAFRFVLYAISLVAEWPVL